jgi:hypothetical protein
LDDKEAVMLHLNAQSMLADTLANLLDRVSQRSENGPAVQAELGRLMADAGGPAAKSLIQRAQGVVGMVNASTDGDPLRARAYQALTEYKLELRNLAASDEL